MTRPEFHELDAASREAWECTDRCEAPRRILPDLDQVACKACCNTPDEECICSDTAAWEIEREARKRARRQGRDYRPNVGGHAA